MTDWPDPPGKVRPEELRTECMACGGSGRLVVLTPVKSMLFAEGAVMTVPIDHGACLSCKGEGRHLPRKIDT